ncbi:MAG: cyclic pyranopterin monophosphate synthase MoaC [Myxococcota bacterium]|nr:cyclic pyranopterin monophosphate synthase MoaC [Myxococcota bacterium]
MKKKSKRLTHLRASGEVSMVDIAHKSNTERMAIAEAIIKLKSTTLQMIQNNTIAKGSVLSTARIAGIMGAKHTGQLIPLCHPINLSHVGILFEFLPSGIRILARASTVGPTGVEMEAMAAVSVAALTIYDMVKGVERGASISTARLLEKSGGKSGRWFRRGVKWDSADFESP